MSSLVSAFQSLISKFSVVLKIIRYIKIASFEKSIGKLCFKVQFFPPSKVSIHALKSSEKPIKRVHVSQLLQITSIEHCLLVFACATVECYRRNPLVVHRRLMVHCCILNVLREGATVERRNNNIWICNACRCRNHSLTTQCGWRSACIELTAVDGSIADQEVAVWAAGWELKRILILAWNARINFLAVHMVAGFRNQWRWVGVILKVNKSAVFKWTLST